MKKLLLITAILLLVAFVICALIALLNLSGYYHVLDGSRELYGRLHRRMVVFAVLAAVFAAAGTGCLVLRFKL